MNDISNIMPYLAQNPFYLNLVICFLIAHIAYLRLKKFIEFHDWIREKKINKVEKALEDSQKTGVDCQLYTEAHNQELLKYSLGIKATKKQRKAIEKILENGYGTIEDIKSSIFYIGLKNDEPEIKIGIIELIIKIYLFCIFIFASLLSFTIFTLLLNSNKIANNPWSLLLPLVVLAGGWLILTGGFPILAAERLKKNIKEASQK